MDTSELDKFRTSWKNEKGFDKFKLSEAQIREILQKKSKDINFQFHTGITVNIILKSILGISFIGLLLLYNGHSGIIVLCILILTGILASVFYQQNVLRKISVIDNPEKSLTDILREKIEFYFTYYIKAIYIGAFSNPLIISSGSLYYFYFKYNGNKVLDSVDILVFGVFILISYILGIYVQKMQFNIQISQLKESLSELDEEKLSIQTLRNQKNKKRRLLLLFILLLMAGILILTFLLLR